MRVGILGGGQLAQMLILAGIPLDIDFVCLDPQKSCPAHRVAKIIQADFDNLTAIEQLATSVDLITFESENIPANILQNLSVPIYPSIKALEIAQDRLIEKQFFEQLGIPVAKFIPVNGAKDIHLAGETLGFPFLLKTRTQGYDGKGQQLIHSPSQTVNFEQLSTNQLIAEKLITFNSEVSMIAARNQNRQIQFYPLTENFHQQGILRQSTAPFLNEKLTNLAKQYMQLVLETLDYIGILTIEFFVTDNHLIVNEMAPRVHNSGHWSIEGAKTSQFENHLRAILNLPLGETTAIGYSAMVNFIGECPSLATLAKIPALHAHFYGKTPRPGRKLGHATLCADSKETLTKDLAQLRSVGV